MAAFEILMATYSAINLAQGIVGGIQQKKQADERAKRLESIAAKKRQFYELNLKNINDTLLDLDRVTSQNQTAIGKNYKRTLGAQTAAYAGGNISVASDVVQGVAEETGKEYLQDIANLKFQARRQAMQLKTNALQTELQAQFESEQTMLDAGNIRKAGQDQMVSSLLGGAGGAAGGLGQIFKG